MFCDKIMIYTMSDDPNGRDAVQQRYSGQLMLNASFFFLDCCFLYPYNIKYLWPITVFVYNT